MTKLYDLWFKSFKMLWHKNVWWQTAKVKILLEEIIKKVKVWKSHELGQYTKFISVHHAVFINNLPLHLIFLFK